MKRFIVIISLSLCMACYSVAQENGKVDVHARYTSIQIYKGNDFESKRPPLDERLFTSEAVEKKIKEVQKLLKKNKRLA